MQIMSRVLLVYHNDLFAHSIRVALQEAPRIELVGELKDWTQVETEIARLTPDVVLVEEDESIATDTMLGALRAHQSSWRVVALGLDATTMHIWSGDGKALQEPQDLYDALRAASSRERKTLRTARRTTLANGGR